MLGFYLHINYQCSTEDIERYTPGGLALHRELLKEFKDYERPNYGAYDVVISKTKICSEISLTLEKAKKVNEINGMFEHTYTEQISVEGALSEFVKTFYSIKIEHWNGKRITVERKFDSEKFLEYWEKNNYSRTLQVSEGVVTPEKQGVSITDGNVFYEISYLGKSFKVKKLQGFSCLKTLIENPERKFSAIELSGKTSDLEKARKAVSNLISRALLTIEDAALRAHLSKHVKKGNYFFYIG